MENFNLLLNKKPAVTKKPNGDIELLKLTLKDKKKGEIGRWKNDDLKDFDFSKGIDYKAISERQTEHARLVCEKVSKTLEMAPDYRMVVGLGNPSVYETSMTLHHIYGFPFIPSTGIKGSLRNYVINKFFDLTEEERSSNPKNPGSIKEKKALQSEWFCRIFGCPPESGRVDEAGNSVAFIGDIVFFDAMPVQPPHIDIDVMTVHYPDYYSDKGLPPADWQNPNPIPFLTVKDGPTRKNRFQFIIGLRKGIHEVSVDMHGACIPLLEFTNQLLVEALTQHGIGAKTAVGYGYFNNTKPV
jgi:CRISPR-associated protein Cmr6